MAGRNVYKVARGLGPATGAGYPIAADVVVPVPDSGNCAALGYSLESGIPFEMAFVRNHYVGRSFLQPSQLIRDFDVRVKLNLIAELVQGKRVVVVDDSIVRGHDLQGAGQQFEGSRGQGSPRAGELPAAYASVRLRRLIFRTGTTDGGQPFARGNPQLSQRRFAGYLSQEGMVRATGLPREVLLHGLLRRELPGALRPGWTSTSSNGATAGCPELTDELAKEQAQIKLL